MKKKITAILLICAALLTSCGSSKSSDTANYAYMNDSKSDYSSGAADINMNYASDEAYESDGYYNQDDSSSDTVHAADTGNDSSSTAADVNISREMLVYSCTMNIDVLEFDKSLESLKDKLAQFGGFVETEKYNDGGSSGRWYYEDSEKWKSYTATVRIPSRNYEDFCSAAGELGDLRSKNASVENLSNEYRDLSTTLKIYESREERYIKMLGEITNEEQAVVIEDKLTQIQIEIAKLKSRMDRIEKDVAYSYVNITVSEVKEYKAEPVKKDTFGQRFVNTLKDASATFLAFLEDLLFFLIYAVPYIVLFGAGITVIVKIIKALKNRKLKKEERKNAKRNKASESPEKKEKTENKEDK